MTYSKGNPEGGLTPITSPWMHNLFERQQVLRTLIQLHGSPINLHHLPTFITNINSYKILFESFGLKYQIFYARKANKCKGLVRHALSTGIGIDTASSRELEQSIQLGGGADSVVLTSAIKTEDQIRLAIKNNVCVIIDNEDECIFIQSIADKMESRAKVGIRLSGFEVEGNKLYSRFGFDIEKADQFVLSKIGRGKIYDLLDLEGIHFHLDGYSTLERAHAASQCLKFADTLMLNDYKIEFIDMGGGILMNYLESERQWNEFKTALVTMVESNQDDLTFGGQGLGYNNVNGKLTGNLNTYPYYNAINGNDFLDEILTFTDQGETLNIAERFVKLGLEIRIEPGRSLLNQCGMTVARVAHRKQDAKGQWLIGMEMNMTQMRSSSADFLLDPFLLFKNKPQPDSEVDVYFTGAYCLEGDVLLKRKIKVAQLPQVGDLVAFVNTAGYMMHFYETEAHLFDLSTNLICTEDKEEYMIEDFADDCTIDLTS